MFETAELKRSISKSEYSKQISTLRTELLEIQQRVLNVSEYDIGVISLPATRSQ